MGGSRITIFDCKSTPCQVENTIPVEKINPLSIGIGTDRIVALRSLLITTPNNAIIDDLGSASMSTISYDGKLLSEFGHTYDFGKYWMLMVAFKSGYVHHFSSLNVTVMAYESFPILYVYGKNNQLLKTFKMENFNIGKRNFDTTSQFISTPKGNYSMISNIQKLDNHNILVEVLQRKSDMTTSNNIPLDLFEYYIIDFETNATHFLGSTKESDIRFQFTHNGAVIFMNDEYYWVPNEKN